MENVLEKSEFLLEQQSSLPRITPAIDEDIIAYLRHSHKIAEIAALAERDALILDICEQLSITTSEEELQAAGDAFRID